MVRMAGCRNVRRNIVQPTLVKLNLSKAPLRPGIKAIDDIVYQGSKLSSLQRRKFGGRRKGGGGALPGGGRSSSDGR